MVVSTRSRPKAAGEGRRRGFLIVTVSTRSRPKAAGNPFSFNYNIHMFQHAAARRRLEPTNNRLQDSLWFQHAAARRRLVLYYTHRNKTTKVSTRSRPKAAGRQIEPV